MSKKDTPHNPHDLLARKVFGTPKSTADLFKNYAGAEVRKTIRWSKLKRLPKHEFGNLLDEHINDGAFTAPLMDGTRSDWGNRWLERFWSVLSTCEQRGTNVMSFLKSCVKSFLHGLAPPSLIGD